METQTHISISEFQHPYRLCLVVNRVKGKYFTQALNILKSVACIHTQELKCLN